jgi:hypothetical protein
MQQDIQKRNFTQLHFKADSNPIHNSFNESNTTLDLTPFIHTKEK